MSPGTQISNIATNKGQESKNLIIEKDRDELGIDKRLTKRVLKTLLTRDTKKQQANITSSKRPSKLENFKISYFS